MTWDAETERELSYRHIAELHADAERYRQARLSRRGRARRPRRVLGWLLRPAGVASRANDMIGEIFSPPWPARRDTLGPSRLDPNLGRR